jgi:hypothetical protein
METCIKSIRIKFHIRDMKILNVIQNQLHFGNIRIDKNKPYCIYTVSIKHTWNVIHIINGLSALKISGFEKACIVWLFIVKRIMFLNPWILILLV